MHVTSSVKMELLRCNKKQNGAKRRPSYTVLSSWLFLEIGCSGTKTGVEYRLRPVMLCLFISNAKIGQNVIRACNTKLSLYN